MNNRINDKIKEIELFFEELNSVIPDNFEQYKNDFKSKAIGERYFEKIIEAVIDLAYFIIKVNKFSMPEEEKELFDILEKEKIIPINLATKLKEAKGMRNIISHQYGNIDNEIVFDSIHKELEHDVQDFIKLITKKKKEKSSSFIQM